MPSALSPRRRSSRRRRHDGIDLLRALCTDQSRLPYLALAWLSKESRYFFAKERPLLFLSDDPKHSPLRRPGHRASDRPVHLADSARINRSGDFVMFINLG